MTAEMHKSLDSTRGIAPHLETAADNADRDAEASLEAESILDMVIEGKRLREIRGEEFGPASKKLFARARSLTQQSVLLLELDKLIKARKYAEVRTLLAEQPLLRKALRRLKRS